MKYEKLMLVIVISLLMAFISITCTTKEAEDFAQKKLDLRQKVDRKILAIDEQLEKLYEKMNLQDSTQKIQSQAEINKLIGLRADLDSILDQMPNITQNEWVNFNDSTNHVLANTDSTLEALTYDYRRTPTGPWPKVK